MIDTRTLGKPDIYTGDENKWQDWKVVVKAYCSVVNPRMGNHAEDAQNQVLNSMLDERDRATSQQLYYILLLLCRQQPLTLVVNAGELEGLRGWKNLFDHYEPNVQTRMAGTLVAILNWSFSGDVQARMELFEREILNYQKRSGEEVSHAMRVGIVLRQLEEGPPKQHLLMNQTRLNTWVVFKQEVIDIRRAQATPNSVPMDPGFAVEGRREGQGQREEGPREACLLQL